MGRRETDLEKGGPRSVLVSPVLQPEGVELRTEQQAAAIARLSWQRRPLAHPAEQDSQQPLQGVSTLRDRLEPRRVHARGRDQTRRWG